MPDDEPRESWQPGSRPIVDKATCRHCLAPLVWQGRWVHERQSECWTPQVLEE